MNLDIDIEEVLQDPDLPAIEEQINDYAQVLALLGDLDSARDLISAQLTAPPIAGGTLANRLLTFAWKETAQLPEGISQKSLEIDLEAARSRYEKDWPDIHEENRTFDERGLQACLSRLAPTKKWSLTREVILVKALDITLRLKHLESTGAHDQEREFKRRKVEPSTASRDQDPTHDKEVVDLIKLLVERWDMPNLKRNLCCAERLWPYFMRGLLADAFGLKMEQVKAKGQIIVETYSIRLHSHPRPFTSKSTRELIELANDNTIKHTSLEVWNDHKVPQALLHDPATDAAISALETRLEVILPDDLKDFLRVTDGFGSGDQGIFTGVFPDPNLRSTAEVQMIDCADDACESPAYQLPLGFLTLQLEIESLVEFTDDHWDTPFPLTEKVIEIGQRDVDAIWLIPPETTKAAIVVYRRIHEVANVEQRLVVDRAVEVFAGSWEELEKLEWCCLSADLGTPSWMWFTSFRQYLERSAWGSRKPWKG